MDLSRAAADETEQGGVGIGEKVLFGKSYSRRDDDVHDGPFKLTIASGVALKSDSSLKNLLISFCIMAECCRCWCLTHKVGAFLYTFSVLNITDSDLFCKFGICPTNYAENAI